jgi:ribosomal protein L18
MAQAAKTIQHRLQVFFSNRHVIGRILRVTDGHIIASASTLEKESEFNRRKRNSNKNNENESSRKGGDDDDDRGVERVPSTSVSQSHAHAHASLERHTSSSDKRACAIIGSLLAKRAQSIAVNEVKYNGQKIKRSDENYAANRKPFKDKRRRFGGKMEAFLDALRNGGVSIA